MIKSVRFIVKFVFEKHIIMKTATINQFLELFNQFSVTEQLKIADKIDKQTFEKRWQVIDEQLPDAGFSEEDIMNEVRAVRYGGEKD